jgi:hypothetical protein
MNGEQKGKAMKKTVVLVAAVALLAPPALAQDESGDLAMQLANPIASLRTLPIQLNYDDRIGQNDDGSVWKMNIQPVIPFSLNEDWHLISRTIMPILYQQDIPARGNDEFGIGDILQSSFFSPDKPTKNGWILGAGPVMLFPTASDDSLGAGQWGLGPTVVALKQEGPWTVGGLGNHLWSVGGWGDRGDVNLTYFEPWVSYTTKANTTISLSAETNYDWNSEDWSVPLLFTLEKLLQIGEQNVQIGGAVKYWAESPTGGPQGLGFRLQMKLLFPK